MELKYKYLEFTEVDNKPRKTRWFSVINHVTDCDLGHVEWDRGWRQYVWVTPTLEVPLKFSRSCHRDMADFLQQLMDERK